MTSKLVVPEYVARAQKKINKNAEIPKPIENAFGKFKVYTVTDYFGTKIVGDSDTNCGDKPLVVHAVACFV